VYCQAHQRAGETYRQPARWNAMSVRNVAGMGRFSSDRTVREYATEIWGVTAPTVAGGL
jgi:glycogen phosphorylase